MKWRRDLFPAEEKVDLVKLDERWTTAEEKLVDGLTPIFNQVLEKLMVDLEKIIDSGKYSDLNDIKMGYKDKLVNVLKQSMIDSFVSGKVDVYSEFSVSRDVVVNSKMRSYFTTKAETTVVYMLDKIKSNAIFTVLEGVKKGRTKVQILADVKGPKEDNSGGK